MSAAQKLEPQFPQSFSLPKMQTSLWLEHMVALFAASLAMVAFCGVGFLILQAATTENGPKGLLWLMVFLFLLGGIFGFLTFRTLANMRKLKSDLALVKGQEIIVEEDRLRLSKHLMLGMTSFKSGDPYVEILWSGVYKIELIGGKNPSVAIHLHGTPRTTLHINRSLLGKVEPQLLTLINERLNTLASEGRRQAPTPAQLAADKREKKLHLFLVGCFIVSGLIIGLQSALRPFVHTISAQASVLLVSGFVAAVGAFIYSTREKRSRNQIGLLFLGVMALTYNFVFVANFIFDHSAPTPHDLMIIEKNETRTKNGVSHTVVFSFPLEQKYLIQFDESSRVRISAADFQNVQPGLSIVKANIKVGALNLPYFTNWSVETKGDARKALIEWKPEPFDYGQPESYYEDRWPNGQLRTKEPLVNGKRHGLGLYWWSDGREYSRIQWKDGKKHGTYKTYRPDGTLEGEFTYKEDRLHGMQRWFTETGALKQEELYSSGAHIPKN